MVQDMAVFVLPVITGVNACDCPFVRVTAAGDNVTVTGGGTTRFTVATADFVGSVWLVAVIVMLCADVILAGAV